MSSTVKSRGFIAILKTPIDQDQRDEWFDKLYDDRSDLELTYDGKLVFSDVYRHDKMRDREDIYELQIGTKEMDVREFATACEKYGLEIFHDTIQPYYCVWYNGTDSPVSLLTPESLDSEADQLI